MTAKWCAALFFVIVVPSAKLEATEKPQPPPKDADFIVPTPIVSPINQAEADKFEREDSEYLFVDTQVTFTAAGRVCLHDFGGDLAIVDNLELGYFLAEALSETRFIFDSMWIAGRKFDNTTNQWEWIITSQKDERKEIISDTIVNMFEVSTEVAATDRDCLGFSRLNHDKPQFRPLTCRAKRSIICERPRGSDVNNNNETHPGWIKIGKRYYKIFANEYNYKDADAQCGHYDVESSLAVIPTFLGTQLLGRYLLIGRPSLENAWIGGEWSEEHVQYNFPRENELLSNMSDDSGYPPWRNRNIQKKEGCLLLDRHISNITYFVEARCDRLRPYMCYKIQVNDTVNISFSDVIIGNDGYRLHFNKLDWEGAFAFCRDVYKDYDARLQEVEAKQEVYNLLYVMGENKTAVQHVWLGGKYVNETWEWQTSKIPVDRTLLHWVVNNTYTEEVEEVNLCLDMDRENHLAAMHYGTNCFSPQAYICHFTAENLKKLEEDERNDTYHAGK